MDVARTIDLLGGSAGWRELRRTQSRRRIERAVRDGEVRGWSSRPFGQDWVRWTLLSWQRVRAGLVATAPPRAMLRRAG